MIRRFALLSLAVAAILVLLLGVTGLAAEAWLRFELFGLDGILRSGDYVPGWATRATCSRHRDSDSAYVPGCRSRRLGALLEINSSGWNDREVDESLPHFRVLVLGDSLTVATGVPTRESFHAVLEERLDRELGTAGFVELYNRSFPGWSTADYVRELERATGIERFDAVLVAVSPTDLMESLQRKSDCSFDDPELRLTPEEWSYRRRGLLGNLRVVGWLEDLEVGTGLWIVSRFSDRLRALLLRFYHHPRAAELRASLEAKARARYDACAVRLRDAARARGIELAWVVISHEHGAETDVLVGILRELDEPVVTLFDAEPRLQGIEQRVIFPGDNHPSAAVHRVYADLLYEALEELGWIAKMRAAG